jgi:hypothetical protein
MINGSTLKGSSHHFSAPFIARISTWLPRSKYSNNVETGQFYRKFPIDVFVIIYHKLEEWNRNFTLFFA